MAKVGAGGGGPSKVWIVNPLNAATLENAGVDNPAFYDSESCLGSKDETFQKKHPNYPPPASAALTKRTKSVIWFTLVLMLVIFVIIVTAIVLLAMKEVRYWQEQAEYQEAEEGITLVEGYLRITNRVFTKDLLSPHNPAYRKLSIQIIQSMDTVFLHSLENYNETRVLSYKEGSVIVRCLIHFSKPRMDTTHQVGMAVVQALERHHGYLPGGLLQVDIRSLHFTGLTSNVLPSVEVPDIPVVSSTTTTTTSTTTTTTEAGECGGGCEGDQVCLYLPQTAEARCLVPRDPHDPTGCGGWCVPEHQVCKRLDNATFQCADNSALCKQGEWKCSNGLCIGARGRCNGKVDCYDMSDEIDCECGEGHFLCGGNSTPCLPLSKKCDGRIDCWDASDEVNCTATSACGPDHFTCSAGSCVRMSLFCDRFPDCPDGSDEPEGCGDACLPTQRPCRNGRCVAETLFCNGVDDCRDASDETDCSGNNATTTVAATEAVVTTPDVRLLQ